MLQVLAVTAKGKYYMNPSNTNQWTEVLQTVQFTHQRTSRLCWRKAVYTLYSLINLWP